MDNFYKILILFPSFVCCYCFLKLSEITNQMKSLEILILELKAENAVLRDNLTLMSARSSESTILQNITKDGANADADFYAGLLLAGLFAAYVFYVLFYTKDGSPSLPSSSSEIPINSSPNVLSTSPNNLVENIGEALNLSSSTPAIESSVDSALNNSEKSGIALEAFRCWLQEQPYPLESSFSVIEVSTRSYIYVTTVITDPVFHNSCVSKMQALGLIL